MNLKQKLSNQDVHITKLSSKCNGEKKQHYACIHKEPLIQLKDTCNTVLTFRSDL